jgi:hypothetical protein
MNSTIFDEVGGRRRDGISEDTDMKIPIIFFFPFVMVLCRRYPQDFGDPMNRTEDLCGHPVSL